MRMFYERNYLTLLGPMSIKNKVGVHGVIAEPNSLKSKIAVEARVVFAMVIDCRKKRSMEHLEELWCLFEPGTYWVGALMP